MTNPSLLMTIALFPVFIVFVEAASCGDIAAVSLSNLNICFFPLPALAASGGQLPLSSLEGGSKVMLGASGGQGGGLPSSLFLNHPALLHMGQNPGAGLISAAVAKASQSSPFPSASSISPTLCSPSPCSSPASSCSSSEMAHSPPSLGGAKIE